MWRMAVLPYAWTANGNPTPFVRSTQGKCAIRSSVSHNPNWTGGPSSRKRPPCSGARLPITATRAPAMRVGVDLSTAAPDENAEHFPLRAAAAVVPLGRGALGVAWRGWANPNATRTRQRRTVPRHVPFPDNRPVNITCSASHFSLIDVSTIILQILLN